MKDDTYKNLKKTTDIGLYNLWQQTCTTTNKRGKELGKLHPF